MRLLALALTVGLSIGSQCEPAPNIVGKWSNESYPLDTWFEFRDGGKFIGTFRVTHFDESVEINGIDLGSWSLSREGLWTDIRDSQWKVSGWDRRAVEGIRDYFQKNRKALIEKHRNQTSKFKWITRDRFVLIEDETQRYFDRVR